MLLISPVHCPGELWNGVSTKKAPVQLREYQIVKIYH